MSTWRRVALILSAGILLIFSALGGLNGIGELKNGGTPLQRSVPIASILYGALGLAAGAGVLFRRRWSFTVAILWALAITYTGTVASVAWAEPEQPIVASLVGAFLLCAVISGLIVWGVHAATRPTPRRSLRAE
jgi:hypothetical protein